MDIDRLLRLALWVTRKLPPTARADVLDDLVNEGALACLRAVARYDPARGVDFWTFASHRIKGAMRDWLRWNRRSAGYIRGASWPIESLTPAHTDRCVVDEPSPEAAVVQRDLQEQLRVAMAQDDRASIVVRRMAAGESSRTIAAALGISESRVFQLRLRAVTRIRAHMALMVKPEAPQ